jgi:beta-galactosidase
MIPKVSQLIYGGNFHPEAWPESLWTEDVALMRRTGVNLVTVGDSCWSQLQSGPEIYIFEWLDRVIDLLHENRIQICLATGTGSLPPWFARLHPEALAASSEGGKTLHRLNSPAYREQAHRLVRQLATRYGPHPALAVWQVNHSPIAQTGVCDCECCTTQFRIWLQQRYKTLDVLNEHWGTAHSSQFYYQWEEILPAGDSPGSNPAQQLDYRRFVSDSLLAALLDEKSILRELTPEVPVTTNFSSESGLALTANGFDWARHVDFISFDSSPDPIETDAGDIAFAYDVQRGLGGGKPWLLRQVSNSGARLQNPVKRPNQMRLWSYQALAHGADGVMFSRWRAASAGAEKFGSAILPHGFTETRSFREAEQLGGELKKLSSIRGATTRAEVALIVDWENMCALELGSQPAQINYTNILRSYYRALFEPDVPIDIVAPEAELTNYKIAVAPALHLVKPGVVENFQSFVDKGGTFLTTFFSGIVDASNRVLPGGHPAAFRSLLGLHVEEFDAFGEQVRHIKTALRGARCTHWADIIRLEGAEAVATFTEEFYAHGPAVTRNAVGRGLAYYVATQPESGFLRAFLAEICADCGVRPPMRVPAGVEVTTRFNEHGEFLFLLNHNATMQFVDIGPRIRRDLLTGEMIKGQCQLAPRDARVLQLA